MQEYQRITRIDYPRVDTTSLSPWRRSKDSVNILFMGDSGAGKSTLINKIFNNDHLCKVNDMVASSRSEILTCTFKETRYLMSIFDISGLPEQIVDMGTASDGPRTVLANTGGNSVKTYPNLILVVSKATEDRPKIVKLKKLLESLQIMDLVDVESVNIVFVLTHCLAWGTNEKRFKQAFRERAFEIRSLANQVLGLPHVTVIPVENHPERYLLEKAGDFFELPNKELTHCNLITTMYNFFEENRDFNAQHHIASLIGSDCSDIVFQRRRGSALELLKSSNLVTANLEQRRFPSVAQSFIPVQAEVIGHLSISDTRVKSWLLNFWNNLSLTLPAAQNNAVCRTLQPEICRNLGDPMNDQFYYQSTNRGDKNIRKLNKVFVLILFGLGMSLIVAAPMTLIFVNSKSHCTVYGMQPNIKKSLSKSKVLDDDPITDSFVTPSTGLQIGSNNSSNLANNFTAYSFDQYLNLLNSVAAHEKIVLTISASEMFPCKINKNINKYQQVVAINIAGAINENVITCALFNFPNVQNITLFLEDGCKKDFTTNVFQRVSLTKLISLTIENNSVCSEVYDTLTKNLAFPNLSRLSIKNGRITEAGCKFLRSILIDSGSTLESMNFIKTTWSSTCGIENDRDGFESVKSLRLDMISSIQLDHNYILNIFNTFPNLEEFESNFGYISLTQLNLLTKYSKIRKLRLNIRLQESSFNLERLLEVFPSLRDLYVYLLFEPTRSNRACTISGYNITGKYIEPLIVNFNQNCVLK